MGQKHGEYKNYYAYSIEDKYIIRPKHGGCRKLLGQNREEKEKLLCKI
jgi:hypothetical protein